jgi:autotransporter-associated beta strand protein
MLGGGGGAGFGGAIFVNAAGSLTIKDSFSTAGNSTAFGSGGASASQGWNAGNDAFFLTGSNITLDPNGATITITKSIDDDSLNSFAGAPVGVTKGTASGAVLNIGNLANAAGTVILQAASSYSGGTNLKKGTLRVNNAFSLGSGTLTFVNPSTLQAGANIDISNAIVLSADGIFDSQGFTFPILGPITGPGSLTKIGAGVLTLSNTNSYGSTIINEGIFEVQGEIRGPVTVNAGTFDVENNFTITDWTAAPGSFGILGVGSTLTFGTSNSTTINSPISGGGSLIKQGTGTATFTGANTYTGLTIVMEGAFVLNGSSTSPTIIAKAGTLKGTGTLASSLTVFGTVRPGNPMGTLNVAGPVTLFPGATYLVELDPAQANLLNVTAGRCRDWF